MPLHTPGDAFQEAVAAELRAEAAARRMSWASISKEVGISRGATSKYINGQRDIPLNVVYSVASALGLSIAELASRAELRMSRDEEVQIRASPGLREGEPT